MKFMMHRNRTVISTCGLSIEFIKGELHHVPAAMYAEVIAVGGVPESEIPEDEMPKGAPTPEQLVDRDKQMQVAFKTIVERGNRDDFTAGGAPHNVVVSRELGWTVQAKERDAAWIAYQAGKDD